MTLRIYEFNDIALKLQPPLDCAQVADFRGTEFHNRLLVNYEGIDFEGCVLYHCFPSGMRNAIEVNRANSEKDVSLKDADFREYLGPPMLHNLSFQGAYLKNANFGSKHLIYTNFQNADLEGANFERATLSGADFTGANLKGANLKTVDGSAISFNMADLEDANLSSAYLGESQFIDANLKNADFELTNLHRSDLDGANCKGTSFRRAVISSAEFKGANFEGADFKDAIYDGHEVGLPQEYYQHMQYEFEGEDEDDNI